MILENTNHGQYAESEEKLKRRNGKPNVSVENDERLWLANIWNYKTIRLATVFYGAKV